VKVRKTKTSDVILNNFQYESVNVMLRGVGIVHVCILNKG